MRTRKEKNALSSVRWCFYFLLRENSKCNECGWNHILEVECETHHVNMNECIDDERWCYKRKYHKSWGQNEHAQAWTYIDAERNKENKKTSKLDLRSRRRNWRSWLNRSRYKFINVLWEKQWFDSTKIKMTRDQRNLY